MNARWRQGALLLCIFSLIALLAVTQPIPAFQRGGLPGQQPEDTKLPNGKSQRDEILKSEHEQNVKDAARLDELVEELKADIEKNDRYVLSISTMKKMDEIDRLLKKLRARLRH